MNLFLVVFLFGTGPTTHSHSAEQHRSARGAAGTTGATRRSGSGGATFQENVGQIGEPNMFSLFRKITVKNVFLYHNYSVVNASTKLSPVSY